MFTQRQCLYCYWVNVDDRRISVCPLLPDVATARLRDERKKGPRSKPPERGPIHLRKAVSLVLTRAPRNFPRGDLCCQTSYLPAHVTSDRKLEHQQCARTAATGGKITAGKRH